VAGQAFFPRRRNLHVGPCHRPPGSEDARQQAPQNKKAPQKTHDQPPASQNRDGVALRDATNTVSTSPQGAQRGARGVRRLAEKHEAPRSIAGILNQSRPEPMTFVTGLDAVEKCFRRKEAV
jgi:hypothetical protein